MAAGACLHNLLLTLCLCLCLLHGVHARSFEPRGPIIITSSSGNVTVVDPTTREAIAQGAATDGSGDGFSAAALIWIGFCFLVGAPMTFAGIRGWRLTTGVGIAVSAGVLSWAAIINSVNETGISDMILTAVVGAFMFLGFCLGVFEFVRVGAMVLLTLTGGLAFGIRVALTKDGLLVESSFAANWAIITVFGVLPGLVMIWLRRPALVFACASTGTFLLFLGIDLVLNKQDGISRGLRFLFDRNSSHLSDILSNGYHPSFTTRINIYVSLGITPVLAFAQHKIFKQPFVRKGPPPNDAELCINYPTDTEMGERKISQYISNIWDRNSAYIGSKLRSANRFSL